jgi:hypothetical protein
MAASNLPYVLGVSSLPWSLWGLLRFVERTSATRLLVGAALLAMPALAGEPQSMLLAGVIGTVWVTAEAAWARAPSGGARIRQAARAALLAGAWGVAALLLSGPAAAPAAARLVQTSRARGISQWEADQFATQPERLLGLLIPDAFDDSSELPLRGKKLLTRYQEFTNTEHGGAWSASILFGVPGLLLAAAGAARRAGRFFLLGSSVFLLASLGEPAGVNHALMAAIPGFQYFRYAEKLIGPATLLLCCAAAIGADAALAGSRRAASVFALCSAAVGAVLVAARTVAEIDRQALTGWLVERGYSHEPALATSMVDALTTGLLLAGGLAIAAALGAALRAWREHAAAFPLVALACAASPLLCASAALSVAPKELLHGPFALANELFRRAGPSEGRWRLYTQAVSPIPMVHFRNPHLPKDTAQSQALMPQYEALARIEGVSPYFSANDDAYFEALERFPSRLFRVLDVRFAVINPGAMTPALAKQKGFHRISPGYWVKDFGPSPRAFLADGAQVASTERGKELLANPRLDPQRTAVLPLSQAMLGAGLLPDGTSDPGSVHLLPTGPERLAADVDAKRPGLLLFATHWDAGWRARVDGRPASVAHVDFAIPGVPVPPGRHRVELEFHPEGLPAGLWMLAAGLLLVGGWALFPRLGRSGLPESDRSSTSSPDAVARP